MAGVRTGAARVAACQRRGLRGRTRCRSPVSRAGLEPARMKRELPADFIWGVSASGYQSEGGNVDSNWDRYNASPENQDPYGRSIDFRHRYREDVALARQQIGRESGGERVGQYG